MKTLSILLLSLLITFSVSLSKPHHHGHGGSSSHHGNDGFTVDLIHRDSPLSPLYNPSYARLARVENAFLRSVSRASRILRRVSFYEKIDADIIEIPGEYIMYIRIGTPPVEVLGVADTGSDLTWAQCEPCKNCYKQIGPPYLVPSSSSTYQAQSCQSMACEALSVKYSSCDLKNMCQYKMAYGDRSYTKGDLAMDTFWFGQTPLNNVVFGCGHDNNGTFNEIVSGIIGLGGGPLSLVNQLKSVVEGKFSYCLIPQFNDNINQTSKIHFGDRANVSGPDVVSTPLVTKDPSTYYYVTLENIVVGNNNLSLKKSISTNDHDVEEGNIIVDSGTTLTLLPRDLHDDLIKALTDAINGETVEDSQGLFELCYKDLNLDNVPNVTFQFSGADIELPPAKTFLEVQKGLSCLTIVPSDSVAIFGNILQQNLLVGFDLINKQVNFKPTDCISHAVG